MRRFDSAHKFICFFLCLSKIMIIYLNKQVNTIDVESDKSSM